MWKPYIILDALEKVREGDYVFYLDSGACFFSSVMPLIESMGDCDIWVSNITFIEEQWTKPQVFEKLDITDENIKTSPQIQGGLVLVRKSEESLSFIREWLSLSTRPELIKPLEPDEYRGECIEHREDQSILSVLSKLHGIKPHKSPAILPGYYPVLLRKLKSAVKKLLGRPVPPKQSHAWDRAKRVQLVHNDTYSPCIYLHRIRKAGSFFSVGRQVFMEMLFRIAAKLFHRHKKD